VVQVFVEAVGRVRVVADEGQYLEIGFVWELPFRGVGRLEVVLAAGEELVLVMAYRGVLKN
jgi:hypothetical protein